MWRPSLVRINGDEPVFSGSNDGDIQVSRWSNAELLYRADKSQYPYLLLASTSVLRWSVFS